MDSSADAKSWAEWLDTVITLFWGGFAANRKEKPPVWGSTGFDTHPFGENVWNPRIMALGQFEARYLRDQTVICSGQKYQGHGMFMDTHKLIIDCRVPF